MLDPIRPLTEICKYHIHVYFDASSRARAVALLDALGARFAVQMGRIFEQPVGPHPLPQYEIGVLPQDLGPVLGWLMLNHQGLSILLHPNTDSERLDHSASAFWLGTPLPLLLERLEPSLQAAGQYPPRAVVRNSTPTLPA